MKEDQTNWQIETAANIARLQVTVEGIEGTIERIDTAATPVPAPVPRRRRYLPWAELLKRTFRSTSSTATAAAGE